MRKPMVISYRMGAFLAHPVRMVKTPHVGLPVFSRVRRSSDWQQRPMRVLMRSRILEGWSAQVGVSVGGLIGGDFAERSIDALQPLVEGR